ncbi:hypothetical protein CCACVL1_14362 [Corchorus capsularis]|uniref:Uncharacterized protein n=1 Tax=Corchorus capsularis TaxID=210143 RepID=A0A1R3I7A1_COCAP|nr:hypothetical protein CCACVL1_14362 [Corchorus capsularis]
MALLLPQFTRVTQSPSSRFNEESQHI